MVLLFFMLFSGSLSGTSLRGVGPVYRLYLLVSEPCMYDRFSRARGAGTPLAGPAIDDIGATKFALLSYGCPVLYIGYRE